MMAIYIWHNKQTKEDKTYECSLHEIESFLDTVPDPDNWYRVIQPIISVGNKEKGYYNNQKKELEE